LNRSGKFKLQKARHPQGSQPTTKRLKISAS